MEGHSLTLQYFNLNFNNLFENPVKKFSRDEKVTCNRLMLHCYSVICNQLHRSPPSHSVFSSETTMASRSSRSTTITKEVSTLSRTVVALFFCGTPFSHNFHHQTCTSLQEESKLLEIFNNKEMMDVGNMQ